MTSRISIRQSELKDKEPIERFLNFEYFVHHHVDWRPYTSWHGSPSFQLACDEDDILACLLIPHETKDVAWIRVFACSSLYAKDKIFKQLFEKIIATLPSSIQSISALGLQQWFVNLLVQQSFTLKQHIIILEWNQRDLPSFEFNPNISISSVEIADIPEIVALDKRSFPSIWQVPQNSMQAAFEQAGYFTKAICDNKIVGYQLCTQSQTSAYLARLAVDPELQRKSVGSYLLFDLLRHYHLSGIKNISVNTQDDNYSSQALYKKMGFTTTEEKYPVYIYEVPR